MPVGIPLEKSYCQPSSSTSLPFYFSDYSLTSCPQFWFFIPEYINALFRLLERNYLIFLTRLGAQNKNK
jgi:hypothetical protein